MKYYILILLLFSGFLQSYAQNSNDKAKAYYFNAEEQYQNKNYNKAIEYCEEVEKLLGNTNACVEALRVKSYYHSGQIEKAKKSLDDFLSLGADESLLKEVAPYTAKIEEVARKKEKLREQLAQGIKPDKYDYMEEFKEGFAVVKIGKYPNEKCGYIDKMGKELTPLKYDIASSFSEGMAMVGSRNLDDKNNKVGFIDTTGKVPLNMTGQNLFQKVWQW